VNTVGTERAEQNIMACTVCGVFGCPAEATRLCRAVALAGPEIDEAYREYFGPLLRYARRYASTRYLSDADVDAEGAVQDAFIAAMVRWHDLDEPRAYLFTVVRNLISRGTRSSSRRWLYEVHDAHHEQRVWWSSRVLDAPMEHAAAGRRVFEVLAKLPHKQKVATFLKHVDGLSLEEIADLLGCAPATVAVHIHRGVEKLRNDEFTTAGPRAFSKAPDVETGPRWLSILRCLARFLNTALVLAPMSAIGSLGLIPVAILRACFVAATRVRGFAARILRRSMRATRPSAAVVTYAAEIKDAALLDRGTLAFMAVGFQGWLYLASLVPARVRVAPMIPQCEHCGIGWIRPDGSIACWCNHYRNTNSLRAWARVHIWARARWHRSVPAGRASGHAGLARVVAELRSDPPTGVGLRFARACSTAAAILWTLCRETWRRRQAGRADRSTIPPCDNCGAGFQRDDSTIGCWCTRYRHLDRQPRRRHI
jgi:RNA polymerase sigma factor (sigma-70 family)